MGNEIERRIEKLSEVGDALRALPINWSRVSEFSILWKTEDIGDTNTGFKTEAFPNVRLKFHKLPTDTEEG